MEKPRRWEIAVCGSGTVYLHYGTGSLHIRQEDFIDLAAEIQQLAERWTWRLAGKKFKTKKDSCSSHCGRYFKSDRATN